MGNVIKVSLHPHGLEASKAQKSGLTVFLSCGASRWGSGGPSNWTGVFGTPAWDLQATGLQHVHYVH